MGGFPSYFSFCCYGGGSGSDGGGMMRFSVSLTYSLFLAHIPHSFYFIPIFHKPIFAWIYFHAPDVCHFYFSTSAIVSFSSKSLSSSDSLALYWILRENRTRNFPQESWRIVPHSVGDIFNFFHEIKRKRNRVYSCWLFHHHRTLPFHPCMLRYRFASNSRTNQKLVAFSLHTVRPCCYFVINISFTAEIINFYPSLCVMIYI